MENIYLGPYRVISDEEPYVKIALGSDKYEIVHKGKIKKYNK